MKDRKRLIERFNEAGLKLVITREPIARTTRGGIAFSDVFQMDIRRAFKGNSRNEIFRIWPGADVNEIEVKDVDKKRRQIVLVVKEPARRFSTDIPARTVRPRADGKDWEVGQTLDDNGTMIEKIHVGPRTIKTYTVSMQSPGGVRTFLCGVDERQMFIAELPRRVEKVEKAHECLKNPEVILAEGRYKSIRQGEWFFLDVDADSMRILNQIGRTGLMQKKARIGSGAGNPHIADELIHMPAEPLKHGYPAIMRNEIYVRGAIRHKDHKTLKLAQWKRVLRNTEPQGGDFMPQIGWID